MSSTNENEQVAGADVEENIDKPKSATKKKKVVESAVQLEQTPELEPKSESEPEKTTDTGPSNEPEQPSESEPKTESEPEKSPDAGPSNEPEQTTDPEPKSVSDQTLSALQLRVINHGKKAICLVSKVVLPPGSTTVISYASLGAKQLAKSNFVKFNALNGNKRFEVEG